MAAILAANVVGYGRLVGADEAGTIARRCTRGKELIELPIVDHRRRGPTEHDMCQEVDPGTC